MRKFLIVFVEIIITSVGLGIQEEQDRQHDGVISVRWLNKQSICEVSARRDGFVIGLHCCLEVRVVSGLEEELE